MSAKLLYNLSDENPNLNKQFGCMNGILQVFYRQHYPAKVTVSGDIDKSSTQGERRDLVGEINVESAKETEKQSSKKKKKSVIAKEKHRVSSESSSRPSFSSSPRSSSFSSAEVSSNTTTASQFDPHGENPMPFDLKELVKGSINREMRTKESPLRSSSPSRSCSNQFKESHRLSYDENAMRNKTVLKVKETPRLSLDSRSNSFKNPARTEETVTTPSHRRSNSSVVAKLMGLEVIEDNFETEQRRENHFCDSPRPMEKPIALQRSRSVGSSPSIKKKMMIPMEPAPWKQQNDATAAVTVYGEIQKRLTQLEFKKSGKDLRALKQILEAMEKTTTQQQSIVQGATSPAMSFKSIVVMKSAAQIPAKNAALPNVKVGNCKQTPRKVTSGKQSAMDLTPRPGLYKNQQLDSPTKSNTNSPKTLRSRQALAADSVKSPRTPRMQPKKLGFERESRPTTPKPEQPRKIQRQLGKQQTDSVSPRRKQGMIKPRGTLQQSDDRLSDISLRSDSNISLGSNVDIEVTSRQRLEKNYDFPEIHTPKQRSPDFGIKPSLKPLKVTVEQPSPVSVLDSAAFDEEDSPSPVRKVSLIFKDDDESEWMNKPTQESDLFGRFTEESADFKSNEHKYIAEILLASGLLRDLEYSMVSIQLHQTRLPINPGLFFILEQNKTNNKHIGRGFRQQQTNSTEKIRRKLVFDTVNEILAKRFAAEGCTKPRLTANPVTTIEKRSKEEQLLDTLCSEIDKLQQNNSKYILEDDEEDLVWEDLQTKGMNLKEFEAIETPGIVLDIERMIFRDLVSEVCFC